MKDTRNMKSEVHPCIGARYEVHGCSLKLGLSIETRNFCPSKYYNYVLSITEV